MNDLPDYRVVLINPDDQTERVFLVVENWLPDATTERISVHPVPRDMITDFGSLDHRLRLIGYRRTGDWHKMPFVGGVMVSVEPLSLVASAAEPARRWPPQDGPAGSWGDQGPDPVPRPDPVPARRTGPSGASMFGGFLVGLGAVAGFAVYVLTVLGLLATDRGGLALLALFVPPADVILAFLVSPVLGAAGIGATLLMFGGAALRGE